MVSRFTKSSTVWLFCFGLLFVLAPSSPFPYLSQAFAQDESSPCPPGQAGRACEEQRKTARLGQETKDKVDGLLASAATFARQTASGIVSTMVASDSSIVIRTFLLILPLAKTLGQQGFSILLGPTTAFLGIVFAIWVVLKSIPIVAGWSAQTGAPAWRDLGFGFARFVTVLVLLGSLGAVNGGGSASFDYIHDRLVAPILGLGAALGAQLSQKADTSEIAADTARLAEQNALRDAIQATGGGQTSVPAYQSSVMVLVQQLHYVGVLGTMRAACFILDSDPGGNTALGVQALSMVLGFFLLVMFVIFLVTAGLKLLDPILRLTFVLTLLPLLLAAWAMPSPSVRNATLTAVRSVAYAALCFLLIGLIIQVVVTILHSSYGVLGTSNTLFGSLDALLAVDDPKSLCMRDSHANVPAGSGVGPDTIGIDLPGLLSVFITLLLAQGLFAQAPQVAGQLTEYRVQQSLGQEVEGQVRGLGQTGISMGLMGAMSAGTSLIRLATGRVR